jgi:antitoxin VapB
MDTARLLQSSRCQAVPSPKAERFSGTEVIVRHFGGGVLLLPIEDPWQTLEAGLAAFEPGFQLSANNRSSWCWGLAAARHQPLHPRGGHGRFPLL